MVFDIKRALVTGANGMLGDALCPLLQKHAYKVYATDILTGNGIFKLDIRNLTDVIDAVSSSKPDIIFHLAAETDVDKCELNEEHAYLNNTKGTENMAVVCKKKGIPMVYISTAAVFDGEKTTGYTEEDLPNPLSIYGKSKLKGEEAVEALLSKYYIIRAGWMIGGFNKDKKFVWKIAQLLETKKEIPVVIDKIGSPTFTTDFAKGILSVISTRQYGLYHCVNKGICTRFEIAQKIAEYMNKNDVILKPVTSEVFPLPAPRARSEALLNYRLSNMGLDNMRPWQDALKEYIQELR
jgi:dTDP-4-dehydrorhamnose reductase